MPLNPSIITTKTNCIEYSKTWSLHPFLPSEPPPKLLASIQRIGLLHPPILMQVSAKKYNLVCGHYRLMANERIHPLNTNITCLMLDRSTPSKQILHIILEDQLLSGNLSSIEKAYFFKYCLRNMPIEKAAENYLPVLSEKIQVQIIRKLSHFLELEPELQISMQYGKISDKTAHELLTLTPGDRLTLHDIFLALELGGGKQNRLLALSKDLASREGTTITQLLSGSDYKEILIHPEMNKPQKIANILTVLQKRLFPHSNSAEEIFLKKIQKMNLPATCSISHSQAFERDDISVTMRFKNLAKVEKNILEIKKIVEN
jgi:hypothetical protein